MSTIPRRAPKAQQPINELRAALAGLALQGLLSSNNRFPMWPVSNLQIDEYTDTSIRLADALLAKLAQ